MKKILFIILISFTINIMIACQSSSFDSSKQAETTKIDTIRTLVNEGKAAQNATKEDLRPVLEKFKDIIPFNGGNLEKKYIELQSDLSTFECRANIIKNNIKEIEVVTQELLNEWKKDLGLYSNDSFKKSSQEDLNITEQRYNKLIQSMKKTESQMDLVLVSFRDHVLFFKHKLYASTVNALEIKQNKIETQIHSLINDMDNSIREADLFIDAMSSKT